MTEKPKKQDENPLEDFAAGLSDALPNQSVDVKDSSVPRVEGGQVRMHQSSAKQVQASAVHLEESAAGFVRAGSLDAEDSAVGFAVAREMNLEGTSSSLLIGRDVTADEARTLVLLAGKLEGNVRTLFTPVTALAAGFGLGLALIFFTRLGAKISPFSSRRNRDA